MSKIMTSNAFLHYIKIFNKKLRKLLGQKNVILQVLAHPSQNPVFFVCLFLKACNFCKFTLSDLFKALVKNVLLFFPLR